MELLICTLNSVWQRDVKGQMNNSSLSVADRSARLQRKRHQWRQLRCVGRFIDKCSWPRLFSSYSSNGSVHCKIFLSCGFNAANLSWEQRARCSWKMKRCRNPPHHSTTSSALFSASFSAVSSHQSRRDVSVSRCLAGWLPASLSTAERSSPARRMGR